MEGVDGAGAGRIIAAGDEDFESDVGDAEGLLKVVEGGGGSSFN